jgi:hypothetical protein
MNVRSILGASLAVALLAGSVVAAESLQSGPQAGKPVPGPFHPLNITGSDAGQKACLV